MSRYFGAWAWAWTWMIYDMTWVFIVDLDALSFGGWIYGGGEGMGN